MSNGWLGPVSENALRIFQHSFPWSSPALLRPSRSF